MSSITAFFRDLFKAFAIVSFMVLIVFGGNFILHLFFCVGTGLTC